MGEAESGSSEITDRLPEAIDASAAPAARNVPVNLDDAATADAVASDAGNDDAALDAALAAIKGGQGRDAATAAYATAKTPAAAATPATPIPAAASKPAGAEAPGTTPAATPAAQPVALAAEQKELLSRFKVRESSFVKLEPDERAELLSNLAERHTAQARLYQHNVEMAALLKQQQPATTTVAGKAVTAQTTPATLPDPYAEIDALLAGFMDEGKSLSGPLKAALAPLLAQAKAAQERAEQAESGMHTFWENKAQEDQQAGLAAVKVEGVSLDLRTAEGKANKEKLLELAGRLLGAEQQKPDWSPFKYGWREAISEAFPTTFKAQNLLAQRKSAAQQARETALRGGDPGGSPNRSQPKESEDAVFDRILNAQKQGATREELVAIGAGRS